MLKQLNLSYDRFKDLQSDQSFDIYYIEEDSKYILFMVDITREFVYRTEVSRIDSTNANLIDFETNLKAGAVEEDSIDNGIATVIIA